MNMPAKFASFTAEHSVCVKDDATIFLYPEMKSVSWRTN
jgi:hypothetical protein